MMRRLLIFILLLNIGCAYEKKIEFNGIIIQDKDAYTTYEKDYVIDGLKTHPRAQLMIKGVDLYDELSTIMNNTKTNGVYSIESKIIRLAVLGITDKNLQHNIHHEIGHALWETLPDEIKFMYFITYLNRLREAGYGAPLGDNWVNAKDPPKSIMPSRYCLSSLHEWFAEHVAMMGLERNTYKTQYPLEWSGFLLEGAGNYK